MQTFLSGRRVGYWLSEKKMKKLNFACFVELCRKRGIDMVQLDLGRPLEEQGPLDVILHKLTDLILEADQQGQQALLTVQSVQDYIETHPETVVLDPLPAIRTLLDRCKSYQLIRKIEDCMRDERICTPPFMLWRKGCEGDAPRHLQRHGITFPFICKTRVAHGTNSHEMAIIFSKDDLGDIKPQSVIQNFINHNAVLHKVFVVGDSYSVVERPSIRNFPSRPTEQKAIFFNSHDVSKPECASDLTSRANQEGVTQVPSDDVIRKISRRLREALGVSLFGIDIIINNETGQHAVIDINAFPGYEGVPDFFSNLLAHLTSVLKGAVPGNPAKEHLPAVAMAMCGKPCALKGKDAGSWLVEPCEGGRRAGLPSLGCNAEIPAAFPPQCCPPMATRASSL